MSLIREILLAGGINVRFFDQSNRYFGDYNKVSILVTISEVNTGKGAVAHTQLLERMGVCTDDIPDIRNKMIDNYLKTAGDYFTRPDFLTKAQKRKNIKLRKWPGK